jgi:hypothetical protein
MTDEQALLHRARETLKAATSSEPSPARPPLATNKGRLTDEEAAALFSLLNRAIDNDRYPLSPRVRTLRGIRAKFPAAPPEPPPARPPTPEERSPARAPRSGRPRR